MITESFAESIAELIAESITQLFTKLIDKLFTEMIVLFDEIVTEYQKVQKNKIKVSIWNQRKANLIN